MTKTVEETVDNDGSFWGSITAGVLLGFVIGGTLGLLYAPKSGREIRADIEDVADDLKARSETTIDDLHESALRLVERSRTLLDETRENLVRSVEAGKQAYEQKRAEMTAELEAQLRNEPGESETATSST